MTDSAASASPSHLDSTGTDKPQARLSVAEESAHQVVFAGLQESLEVRVHAVKDDGIEILCSTFYPKNTRLDLQLEPPKGYATAERRDSIALTGTVGKVQMVAAAPTYRMWVQLEDFDPSLLHAIWVQCRSADQKSAAQPTGFPAPSFSAPGWALQLIHQGLVDKDQLRQVILRIKEADSDLEGALTAAGLANAEQIAACKALEYSVPFLDVRAFDISMENRALISLDIARKQQLFPLFQLDGVLTLGMVDPTDLAVIDQVRLETNCQVEPCLLLPAAIDGLIDNARLKQTAAVSRAKVKEVEAAAKVDDESAAAKNANVLLVQSIIEESAEDGASDLHFEPEAEQLRVRMRIDGVMREKATYPSSQQASIVSRIKVLSKLDIAETRRPQDGHFSMELSFGNVDIRVSTIPTVYGENVVLRLLVSEGEVLGLEDLGMADDVHRKMESFLENPHGMILVTGPTGSGKTTTLYSALARLGTPERNVVTVEDPVEKRIQFLRQTEVNPKAGVTFATGLRSILRQDPDVIMIGEIRDEEAAELAVQAALTGHLVLSTLHTNDACGAIVRLNEMGVAPFLITSSLRAVISQRLARKVCEVCAEEVAPDLRLAHGLGLEDVEGITFLKGAGCPTCLHSGYKGRVGLYEMLELNSELRAALLGRASRSEIEAVAQDALFCSMRADGLRRIREGVTTLEEVARIVGLQTSEEDRKREGE